MAKVFKGSIEVGDDTDVDQMNDFIANYWGDEGVEKIFPITLWKLKQLFNAFPQSEVALKVSDVASPLLVDAEWVAFDESLEEILEADDTQPNQSYYVLSKSDFEELQQGGTSIEDRFMIFVGRIGKDTGATSEPYYAFFCIANTAIEGPPTSGEGASTGFKIPNPG